MSDKTLAISCVVAAVICGTFFYPEPPAGAAASRAKPATTKSLSATTRPEAPANLSLMNLAAPAIAEGAAKATGGSTPTARDWANRIAVVSK